MTTRPNRIKPASIYDCVCGRACHGASSYSFHVKRCPQALADLPSDAVGEIPA